MPTATTKKANNKYYKFDIGKLPDELFHPEVPARQWLDTCQVSKPGQAFPPNSLNQVNPIPLDVELERIFGIALYMAGNVLPFTVLPGILLWFLAGEYGRLIVKGFVAYMAILTTLEFLVFRPIFLKRHKSAELLTDDIRRNQYIYTERNTQKYLSTTYVWPQAMQRPAMENKSMIFCIVPHGVGPIGITAYPLWSKLWNDRLCRWTCAPVVLKLPVVGYFVKKVGYIEAASKPILNALTKRDENVGVILDGISGMFQIAKEERAYVKKRKGIVKIALRAGAPIVPVYGFGHTAMWTVVVDPFGICEGISNAMGAAVTPFFGRFGWFLGPPGRTPVTVALGEPVECPQIDEPTQEQIDEYHAKLLAAYKELFDTHKEAYGWGDKTLKFV